MVSVNQGCTVVVPSNIQGLVKAFIKLLETRKQGFIHCTHSKLFQESK